MNFQPEGSRRQLTFVGRLLIFVTMLIGAAVFSAGLYFAFFDMEEERIPLILLLIPTAVVAIVFFGLSSLVLGMLGIRIWK